MEEPFKDKEQKTFCSRSLNLGLLATIMLTIAYGFYSGIYLKSYISLIGVATLYIISCAFTLNAFADKLYKDIKELTLVDKLFFLAIGIGFCSLVLVIFSFLKTKFVITILSYNCLLDIAILLFKKELSNLGNNKLTLLLRKVTFILLAILLLLLLYCFITSNIPLLIFIFVDILSLCLVQI